MSETYTTHVFNPDTGLIEAVELPIEALDSLEKRIGKALKSLNYTGDVSIIQKTPNAHDVTITTPLGIISFFCSPKTKYLPILQTIEKQYLKLLGLELP